MRIVIFDFVVALAVVGVISLVADSSTTQLTVEQTQRVEIQTLKEQVFTLRRDNAILQARLADTQAKLDSLTLTEQDSELKAARTALEKELIKALGGTDKDAIDWSVNPPTLKAK